MYHTEPHTDKTIREWYMNSSRVSACALRNSFHVGFKNQSVYSVSGTNRCLFSEE